MILASLALLAISALCFGVAALVLALNGDLFLAVAFVAVPLIVGALVDNCNRFGRRRMAAMSLSAGDADVNAKPS